MVFLIMRPLVVTVFLCAFFVSVPAYAGVTVIQAMSFGNFVSKKNDMQYEVTINTNGTYVFDSAGFIEISAPQEGIYDIDGLTPSAAIASVVITQSSPLTIGGRSFQMINFQETHDASTDAGGVARVTVGATAQGDGITTAYPDNTYNGSLNITISF